MQFACSSVEKNVLLDSDFSIVKANLLFYWRYRYTTYDKPSRAEFVESGTQAIPVTTLRFNCQISPMMWFRLHCNTNRWPSQTTCNGIQQQTISPVMAVKMDVGLAYEDKRNTVSKCVLDKHYVNCLSPCLCQASTSRELLFATQTYNQWLGLVRVVKVRFSQSCRP